MTWRWSATPTWTPCTGATAPAPTLKSRTWASRASCHAHGQPVPLCRRRPLLSKAHSFRAAHHAHDIYGVELCGVAAQAAQTGTDRGRGEAQDYVIFISLTADAVSANLLAASQVTVDGAPGNAESPHYFAAPVDCTYSNATAALEAYNTGNPDVG